MRTALLAWGRFRVGDEEISGKLSGQNITLDPGAGAE